MPKLLVSILILLLSTGLLASGAFTEQQLREKAEGFIQAKNARQQPDTTVEDIDRFIALLADDFVDEHVRFNVTVTDKDELRKGMIAKMDDEVDFCKITIDDVMFGRNVAFVKYTEHARVKPNHMNEVIEYTSTNILSLEFDENGLVRHIRRYHGL